LGQPCSEASTSSKSRALMRPKAHVRSLRAWRNHSAAASCCPRRHAARAAGGRALSMAHGLNLAGETIGLRLVAREGRRTRRRVPGTPTAW
jgi:hypothetical protein